MSHVNAACFSLFAPSLLTPSLLDRSLFDRTMYLLLVLTSYGPSQVPTNAPRIDSLGSSRCPWGYSPVYLLKPLVKSACGIDIIK